jgi:hypothetical protein
MNQPAERILPARAASPASSIEWKIARPPCPPEHDRRTILVATDTGNKTKERARLYHRDGIERHFAQHLTDADVKALTRALEKISTHARPLRPGRIRG